MSTLRPAAPVVSSATGTAAPRKLASGVLAAITSSHLINDMMQSLILALYPVLKGQFQLSFAQVGLITLTYQITASLFQPLIGLRTDRRPAPYSLPMGMGSTLCGLLLLAYAPSFGMVLLAAALVGIGSAIFHPESSRIARLASGGRHGLAQSVFQVGGNTGTALGPLIAAAVIVPNGRHSVAWFGGAALLGIALLSYVGRWYALHLQAARAAPRPVAAVPALPRATVVRIVGILLLLIFSKYFYIAGLSSYYTFYLIQRFGLSVQSAQLHLFAFLLASALGTLIGGPVGDRIGRKPVIWVSILGVAPFALALPHVGLHAATALTVVIGFVLSSAFSAILVYAQEMMPGRIGTISGLFFGFAFGMGGLGAAVLGLLADQRGIVFVYQVMSFLPLLGIVAAFLPSRRPGAAAAQ
ncbi:MFS transporter [Xanthomonas rydalmerensis]|uniref:MFS transporter n=1 Tax=Xanthomonas rydalmerensis TaxID=3046274 RepID=A0ABZ0JQ59_9XANT|nr:MFS transporter [Xanthomonas sp. DM-2023]WOS41959.1 MFS transporter [Xanthomonas sp. DM-2023]WOS46145.1 MFS transporter [Xanthomonas sp. DM-2023]WOS50323.1 MFS transporter [Xanthomonas sp. DM-2023]WOS54503.1 MFS transporter [Xanthomonas sp. DM-2023]WOS58686.1 MFS transporter [Xanthomonas sp. DM-2023]